jgi:hypothetical protein
MYYREAPNGASFKLILFADDAATRGILFDDS